MFKIARKNWSILVQSWTHPYQLWARTSTLKDHHTKVLKRLRSFSRRARLEIWAAWERRATVAAQLLVVTTRSKSMTRAKWHESLPIYNNLLSRNRRHHTTSVIRARSSIRSGAWTWKQWLGSKYNRPWAVPNATRHQPQSLGNL